MVEPLEPWPRHSMSKDEEALFIYISDGNIERITLAIDRDYRNYRAINLNSKSEWGETPLLFAMRKAPEENKQEIVKTLLSVLHVFVDIADNNGYTPLHEAVLQDNPEIMLKLLYKHADPLQENKRGESAIDLLKANNCPNIKHILENNTPKWLQEDNNLHALQRATKHSDAKAPKKPKGSPNRRI